MGMTHGTIAGMLIRDLVLGVETPWQAVFDPGRVPLRAAGEALRENLNVAAQYADWIGPGEVKSVDEIAAGSGAVVRRGLGKLAVYRDEAGRLHACSAACPHLKPGRSRGTPSSRRGTARATARASTRTAR
jgi:hypothetical protein